MPSSLEMVQRLPSELQVELAQEEARHLGFVALEDRRSCRNRRDWMGTIRFNPAKLLELPP